MVTNGSKSGAPHELNVWRFVESRAPELESLHSIVAGRSDNDFKSQRNKRRRTTGHDDRVARKRFRKRRKIGVLGDIHKPDSAQKEEKKKKSRRERRNIELKKSTPTGFGNSGDGTKRLRTHIWHAKRFTMKKIWGFYIPLGLHGRGRGSRALLKKLKNGVLIHDASYYGSIQLEGAEETLMSVLSSVLVPSPSACFKEVSHDILAGRMFGTAMLHHGGKPCFSPIAPITYMWRPLNEDENNGNGPITRQLWVWIHGAALQESYDALSSACERHTDTTRSAQCISREGQLAKLELIGSKVFQLLQKTLLPAIRNTENSWPLKKCLADKESEKISIFKNADHISSSAIVLLVVKDPRTLTKKENVISPEGKSLGVFSNEECQNREQNESESDNDCSDLWDVSKGAYPPVEESVLCMEKHYQRKEFVRVGRKNSGPHNAPVDGKFSRVCPVVLLNDEKNEDSVARCSIVLPLSWVKAFWITFISNGAQAIGLREKHWVASNIGLPYFPLDFPDCNAYSHYMDMEASEINTKTSLRPPSKIPVEVPIPPPWNCVYFTLEKRFSKHGNTQIKAEKNGDQDGKNNDSCCGKSHSIISTCHGAPYKGVIARTGCMLRDFLNSISGNHFLLFPRLPDQKSCLHKFMRNEAFLKQDSVVSEVMNCGETLCYTRIHLHACKEGVFEQGAVVCAPLVADITSWAASAESDERLQIPQPSLKSYFIQLPSGEWELQIPEDEALHGSYRWPIGFITAGFVRGSKKAIAGALCEASLLSGLRQEQWKALPVKQRKKEIYVLVRNLRSTAYRLALATIILEEQEQDVKFM